MNQPAKNIAAATEAERIVAEAMRATTLLKNRDLAETLLNTMHPRTIFLKSLPANASVLDLGAGEGSIIHFKSYLVPTRNDLKFYAFSLEKGEHFHLFDGYEIQDWNKQRPDFGGKKFDAICASHFIEHIDHFEEAVPWCLSRLAPGGRLYLEWPSEHSLAAPTNKTLQALGLNVQIGNFFDDSTHSHLPDRSKVIELIEAANASVDQQGYVRFPLLESELFYFFRDKPFSYPLQAAYWSLTKWCQYIIAS